VKQIPTPQLVRISSADLVPVATQPQKSNDIWEQFLRVQLKPSTQATYHRAITRFCQDNAPSRSPSNFIQEFLVLPQREAIQLVLEWRQKQVEAGLASATINQQLAAIKSLVDFANKAEI
jgi:integrase/recombinase XerC